MLSCLYSKKSLVKTSLIFALFIGLLFGFFYVLQNSGVRASNDNVTYIVNNDTVCVNDSNVYISVEPHTLHSSGWIYLNFTSKVYTGNVDMLWGFNTTEVRPKKAELYYPHNISWETTHFKIFYNISEYSDTIESCEYGYEYNTYKKLITYTQLDGFDNQTNKTTWKVVSAVVCFDSFEDLGNNDYKIIWHQKHIRTEKWLDISDRFNSIDYEYGGMNKWYYVTNIPIQKDTLYTMRAYMEVPVSLEPSSGKYWVAFKPSSESLHQAIQNKHLYYIDPWWDSNWLYRREITITEKSGNDLLNYPIVFEVEHEGKANSDCSDIRVVNGTTGEIIPFGMKNCDSTYVELTIKVNVSASQTIDNIYVYYGNPHASFANSSWNSIRYNFFDDFDGNDLSSIWKQVKHNGEVNISNSNLELWPTGYQGGGAGVTIKPEYQSQYGVQFGVMEFKWTQEGVERDYFRAVFGDDTDILPNSQFMSAVVCNQSAIFDETNNLYGGNGVTRYKYKYWDGNSYIETEKSSENGYQKGTIELRIYPDGTITYKVNGTLKDTVSNGINVNENNEFYFVPVFAVREHGGGTLNYKTLIDYVKVYSYVEPEPTYSVGEEETLIPPPSITNIHWITTGGFSSSNLNINQVLDSINCTVTNATEVNITVKDPDGINVVNNEMMSNISNNYYYSNDIVLSKAGTWIINITAKNEYHFSYNSSSIIVSTQNISIKDGWYGYTDNNILSKSRIATLSGYDYDLFEMSANASDASSTWDLMLDSINNSRNVNIHVGINYRLDWNYTDYAPQQEFLNFIAENFSTLTEPPYTDTIEYISLELVNPDSYTDEQKVGVLNNISKNITAETDNSFVIFSKNFNSSNLDNSYIQYTKMIYLSPTSKADFINEQRDYFKNSTSLNRVYVNISDDLKSTVKDFHKNIIDRLRSKPNKSSVSEDVAVLSNGDILVFNNQSSPQSYTIDISELVSNYGKDVWDYTHHYIIEKNTDLIFSVDVDAYSATIVIFEDIDHIQMTSLNRGSVYKGAISSTKKFNYTDGVLDGNWALYGANDIQIELFDPHYKRNNFIVYYGWLNSSYIKSPEGWENYDIVIIADKNDAELDKLNYNVTEFYGYISVADYNNSEGWLESKKNEVDEWLNLNESLNIFLDGLDVGVSGTNFSSRMKDLVDYIQITKGRKAILNTYTAYEDFATWGKGGVMKESCVNRWNGNNPASPDNYTRENWTLELQKADWYKKHNVRVLCQAFDDRVDDGSYTILNYTELQNIYFASKVLGYDYFYLSQPDFNYAHLEYVYDVGEDLDKTYHQLPSDPNVYYRAYEKGIVYYNSSSGEGWIDDGRIINNVEVCFYLYNPDANDNDFEFVVNNRQPEGSNEDYIIDDDWPVGTWKWKCVNITPSTNGRYLIEGWVDDHTTIIGQGLNIGYSDYASQDRGIHSWWDASTTDSWNAYQADRNWMINISVTETKKTSIDTTDVITQSENDGNSVYNITLSSTKHIPVEVWSYPVIVRRFERIKYLNSSNQWVTLNYANTTDCDSDNPTWNTTIIEGEVHKACIKKIDNGYIVRVAPESLSTRIYQIDVETIPPKWKNNISSTPAYYSPTIYSWFNVTWIDNLDLLGFNVSYIEANFSGTLQNYTASRDGNVAYYKVILPAGTYQWKFYANDSSNNWNSTDTWYVTINKHSNPIKWRVISSSGTYINQNVTTDNSTPINITAWLYYPNSGTLKIYNDTAEEPLNISRNFNSGIYNYTINTTGNTNYVSNETTFILTVLPSTTTTTTTSTTIPSGGGGGIIYTPSPNEKIIIPNLNISLTLPLTVIPKQYMKLLIIDNETGMIYFNQSISNATKLNLPKGTYKIIAESNNKKFNQTFNLTVPSILEINLNNNVKPFKHNVLNDSMLNKNQYDIIFIIKIIVILVIIAVLIVVLIPPKKTFIKWW